MSSVLSSLMPRARTSKKVVSMAAGINHKAQISLDELYKEVEQKAYELYENRGCVSGFDCADWLEAERITKAKYPKVLA